MTAEKKGLRRVPILDSTMDFIPFSTNAFGHANFTEVLKEHPVLTDLLERALTGLPEQEYCSCCM